MTDDVARPRTGTILHARAGRQSFEVTRIPPSPDLEPFVEHYWLVTWDLRGRAPHRQQILTHPCVHMTFTRYTTAGTSRSRIVGVVRGEFVEEIRDQGHVVGTQFRAGAFRALLGRPVSTITDRFVAVDEVFGAPGTAAAARIVAAPAPMEAVPLVEEFLRSRHPRPDPAARRTEQVVAHIADHPAITRVDELARQVAMTPRRLQRLFEEYMGVGPKWVIQRFRLQEAAERAAQGIDVDWAELAAELGYADQAHLTRSFTSTIGMPPARYARASAGA